MLKKLDADAVRYLDHGGNQTNMYFVKLDPKYGFEDLFRSSFWDHHRARFNEFDIIRVRANNGEFDVMLTVTELKDSGMTVELWPKFPGHIAAKQIAGASSLHEFIDETKPSKVPLNPVDGKPYVRTEYLAATKWRVLGFDGREIKRDLTSQEAANGYMLDYLNYHKLSMPSDDEVAAAVKAIEDERMQRVEADKAKSRGKTKAA